MSAVLEVEGLEVEFAGRTAALYFEKPSLRTRVSFEVAMTRLGGRALNLSDRVERIGWVEHCFTPDCVDF